MNDKKETNTNSFYGFTVGNVNDIDIERIIKEADADATAIVITTKKGVPEAVALRVKFTSMFNVHDQIYVAGKRLDKEWGYATVMVFQSGPDGFWCDHRNCNGTTHGWRFMRVPDENSIDTVIADIETAKAYRRKIPVTVHSL